MAGQRIGSWLLASGAAVLIGMAAAAVQLAGVAPVGISSLITGSALGGALVAMSRAFGSPGRAKLLLAAGLFSLVAVATVHFGMYRGYCRQWAHVRAENPALAVFKPDEKPPGFVEFLQYEATPGRMTWWIVDAVLVTATAVAIVTYSSRPLNS